MTYTDDGSPGKSAGKKGVGPRPLVCQVGRARTCMCALLDINWPFRMITILCMS